MKRALGLHRVRKLALGLSVATTAAAALLCSVCHADDPPSEQELEKARAMFAEGRRLEDAGQWSQALELFQNIGRVKMTPQVRFHIALCTEHVGLWTEALEGYILSVREAENRAPEVVKEAGEHIANLEKKIPVLTVDVSGAAPEDELFLDGRPIPIEQPPRLMRADPGAHTVELRRGKGVIGEEHFVLEAGATRRITVGAKVATQTGDGGGGQGRTQRILAFTTLGLGAAAAIGTGVSIGLRAGALHDLQQQCPSLAGCDRSVEPVVHNGKTYATLVNVMATVTGACIAGGTVLLMTAPSSSPASKQRGQARQSVWFSASVMPLAGGVAVGGSF